MSKTDKATTILKLLKKGYSPKEITERVAVSYNYAWKLKKDLEAKTKEALTEVKEWVEEKVEPKPEPEVSGIGKVLDERAAQYGSYMQASDTAIRIKGIMHNAVARNEAHLYPDQLQALDMIATKISRIVNGNPNHTDSWIDIAGYATLVADRLQGKTR
jgi:uncharacterized protein YdhG (YjbR/CyaY superfamily)